MNILRYIEFMTLIFSFHFPFTLKKLTKRNYPIFMRIIRDKRIFLLLELWQMKFLCTKGWTHDYNFNKKILILLNIPIEIVSFAFVRFTRAIKNCKLVYDRRNKMLHGWEQVFERIINIHACQIKYLYRLFPLTVIFP